MLHHGCSSLVHFSRESFEAGGDKELMTIMGPPGQLHQSLTKDGGVLRARRFDILPDGTHTCRDRRIVFRRHDVIYEFQCAFQDRE